ncbi:MAG: hypothetical protein PHQ91_13440 [Thermoanaerobaculaceae bacterium]|nr:hypothetical protein [Thermoanaerobaculaceae bacterium]TAM50846.1 MAG: hypothetical protein EPN53_07385 [Acidobacteriota bacterium]
MIGLLLAGALAAAPAPQVGGTLVVDRPTAGPVVVLLGDVRVTSAVVGDVVAVGGDVELAAGSSVRGDVVALGGRTSGPGSVSGRVASEWGIAPFAATRGATRGDAASAWGFALLRAGGWVVLGSLLLLAFPGPVRSVRTQLARQRWRAPLVGALALLVWLAVVVLAMVLAGSPGAVACLLLAVAFLLLAKLVGVVAVASLLGETVGRRLPLVLRGEIARSGVALVFLCVLTLVPLLGTAVWLLTNVVGIGAVVGTALQRRPLALLLPSLAAR